MDEDDLERMSPDGELSRNEKTGIPNTVEVLAPKRRSWDTDLTAGEQRILKAWFKHRPICRYSRQAVRLVAKECRTYESEVLRTVRKANAEAEAKRQRLEMTEAIYASKIPTAKEVVGWSLEKLATFVKENRPVTWEDAQRLTKIATDMQMLLRLELGQSTQNIELVTRTQRDVTAIIQDLSANDPFVDYPALPEGSNDKG